MMLVMKMFRVIPVWLIAAAMVAVIGSALVAQQGGGGDDGPDNAGAAAAANNGDGANAEGKKTSGETTKKMTFLELLAEGGYFMIPIAACSMIGLTIIIERLFAIRRGAVIPRSFMAGLNGVFRHPQRDRDAALHYCRENHSPIARVMAVGIRKIPQGIEQVEQGIEDAGANEVAKLKRNLRLLFGVSSVAPMIGLLGTVWGMIEAFSEVADSDGLGQASALAHGIYTALVTTFAGLCVAIPILVFYYFFIGKIERIVSEMNDVSELFIEQHISGELLRGSDATDGGALPEGVATT